MKKFALAIIGIVAATAFTAPVAAQTVAYTSGPVNGTISAFTINNGFVVSSSFVLNRVTTLGGFSFGGWTDRNATISSVSYGISQSSDTFNPLGTSTLTGGGIIPGTGYGSYDVRNYTGSIAPLTLQAGTYYFALGSAVASNGGLAFWDQNNGVSTATQFGNNLFYDRPSTSFALFESETVAPVPEPATWGMMILGFGVVGASMRRRRSNVRTSVRFA